MKSNAQINRLKREESTQNSQVDLQTLQQMIQQMQQVLASTTDQFILIAQQALAPIAKLAEMVQQAFAPISEQLRQMAEAVALTAEEAIPVFQEGELWFSPSMPLSILWGVKQLRDSGQVSRGRVEQMILQAYKEDEWALLREVVTGWQQNPLFAPRMHIIEDALEAHLSGKYTLSIPALLPQIEGIARNFIGKPRGSKTILVEAIEKGEFGFITSRTIELLQKYIRNTAYHYVPFDEFEEWLKERSLLEEKTLHRHAILHGVQLNYASEMNSLRAFLLLDVLSALKSPPDN